MQNDKLIRIGIFYDGNYFLKVSNYYAYGHARRRRISLAGLHDFIRQQVASEEGSEHAYCQIVDAHYFRGRLSAQEASQRGDTLYYDRVFDDILMSEGITTHYFPIKTFPDGSRQEKGIDVWLALEAYEQSLYKKFNVVVLIASDGDYVPLARKLNTLGTRVMVLGWDFEFFNEHNVRITTRTSQDLLEVVTYPIQMHQLIDDRVHGSSPVINNLFIQTEAVPRQARVAQEGAMPVFAQSSYGVGSANTFSENGDGYEEGEDVDVADPAEPVDESNRLSGEILSLKAGFGFIAFPPNNLFFHVTSLLNADFNDLRVGDVVSFRLGTGKEGNEIATDVRLMR
jgi:uncharacterized LabA/DUF88 family protein/cold shock CspA family protein